MKKVLLICTMMLFWQAVTEVNAQVYYATFGNVSTDRGIVREQGISYYEDGGKGFFVYLPTMAGNTYIVEVPQSGQLGIFMLLTMSPIFVGRI